MTQQPDKTVSLTTIATMTPSGPAVVAPAPTAAPPPAVSGGNGVSATTASPSAKPKKAPAKKATKKSAPKKPAPKKPAPKKSTSEYVSRLMAVTDIVVREGVNPRQTFDKTALSALTASIKAKGILAPLVVAPSEDDVAKFDLVCGERRLRAAKALRMKDVPVVIRSGMSREGQYVVRGLENLQRADLNCIEEAQVFQNFMGATSKNAKETAETFCKTQAYVSQRLKLLTMPKEIQLSLARGELNFTQARELGRMDTPDQTRTFNKVKAGDIQKTEQITRTVENKRAATRTAEAEAKASEGKRRGRPPRTKEHAPDIVRQNLENAVEALNAFAIEAKPKTQTRDTLVTLYERFTNCRSDTKKERLRGEITALEWVLGIRDEI